MGRLFLLMIRSFFKNCESQFGKLKASLQQAHKETILNLVVQAKANRVDLYFDTLPAEEQKKLIKKARQCREGVKEKCRSIMRNYNAEKLRKKERDSQSQRARDINRSTRRR